MSEVTNISGRLASRPRSQWAKRWHSMMRKRFVLPALVIIAAVVYGKWDRADAYATALASFQEDIRQQGMDAGLKLRWVRVIGRDRTSGDQVRALLEGYRGQGLMDIDLTKVRSELLAQPWVENVDVRRLLPNSLEVTFSERKPLVRYYDSERFELIDLNGSVIPSQPLSDHRDLPLLVGKHAGQHAQELMQLIKAFPRIREVMIGAEWVGNRRWTLYLETPDSRKIRALLPELNAEHALVKLERAIIEDQLLERGIIAIDFRLPQVTARLMPEFAEELLRRTP